MNSFKQTFVSLLVSAMAALTVIGCGDSKDDSNADGGGGGNNSPGDAGDDADSGSESDKMIAVCDSPPGDNHTCTEYLSPRPNDIARFKTQCDEVFMGSVVASCPKGRVGGCMLDQGGGVVSTTWYYADDTSASNCGGSSTYVTP